MVKLNAWLAAAATLSPLFSEASPLKNVGSLQARQSTSTNATASNATLWNWTGQTPMHGVSLGNWLLLERWMNEQWFVNSCGNPDARDEWTWSQSLGANAQSVLEQHWNTFITEESIATIAEAGFNHIRIVVGYWAWINQPAGTPYVSMGGQVDQITRVLGYAAKYGLYAVIDLHGLPGSQNGEQPSGHIGYNNFYQDQNQQYGDDTVDAILEYVVNSPYRNIISALAPVNEPIYYSEDQFQTLLGFYERTYAKTSALNPPLPMMFAPGKPQTSPFALYQGFINGKNPSLLIYEDHPYIGRLWAPQSQDSFVSAVCSRARTYANYPIPIAITEWSLSTPILDDTEWASRFYAANARAWAQHAGGIFWSYNVTAYYGTTGQTEENFTLYSFIDLWNAGEIPRPAAGQNTSEYLFSLPDECNFGNTIDTYPSVVPSVQPTVTNAFTSSAGNKRAYQTPPPAPRA